MVYDTPKVETSIQKDTLLFIFIKKRTFTKYHFQGSNLDFNFTNELAMGFFLPRKKLQNPTPFSRYFEWVIFICPPCIIIRLRNRMFSCHGLQTYCISTYITYLYYLYVLTHLSSTDDQPTSRTNDLTITSQIKREQGESIQIRLKIQRDG